jgi:maltooligosyltrehalose trehalohydrolase
MRLPIDSLGAHEVAPGALDFGVLVPWVSPGGGYRVFVKVIHENDQFLQRVAPRRVELSHQVHPQHGDLWTATVDTTQGAVPGSSWGQSGRYVYRYAVERPGLGEVDWVVDPFAREFGVGKLSAITVGYQPYAWSAAEAAWRVPSLRDLVVYELMITEFGGSLEGTIGRLDYLADLGVNCLEVMPVSNVANEIDWGFEPIGYFGVDERFGRRRDFQRLVDEAHQRGIAVMLDVVYGHTSSSFAYSYLYRRLGYAENPFLGSFGVLNSFGESTDFGRPYTRDFFETVNHHWLDVYHVDGFRYDCVPCFWDGPLGQGYAKLAYETYQMVKSQAAVGGHWARFVGDGTLNLIQCAEQLQDPVGALANSYSTCTWQNQTFAAAKDLARGSKGQIVELGFRLGGLPGAPDEVTTGGDRVLKAPLQYIENHDHERFLCNFGVTPSTVSILGEGRRDLWYRLQPYLIGLLTSRGIPLLWQGQELGENLFVPDDPAVARVALLRPVRWELFYDDVGEALVRLVRHLIALRRSLPELRLGNHYFYNDWNRYGAAELLLFSRALPNRFTLVALNFGSADRNVPFAFPISGRYREGLHGVEFDATAGTEMQLDLPSHYGRVWTLAP